MPKKGRPAASTRVAACDFGGSSGRVVAGRVSSDAIVIEGLHRFPNVPLVTQGELRWNLDRLLTDAAAGLRELRGGEGFASIGIDSWSSDYALLRDDRFLEPPYHQREPRTLSAFRDVHDRIGQRELFERTGQCALPLMTRYQLVADRDRGALERADRMLLLPDAIAFQLTGTAAAESTNASTTGLADWRTGSWDAELLRELGLPLRLFAPVIATGSDYGVVNAAAADAFGLDAGTAVIAVATHDTASAVAAIPTPDDDVAFVSSGTWSLVGVETRSPVLSEAARLAGFTNEGGVDGRNRFLSISPGLWILNECLREWGVGRPGESAAADALLTAAGAAPSAEVLIDPRSPVFVGPGSMLDRVRSELAAQGARIPDERAELVRIVIESLADTFARVALQAASLAGKRVRAIHIVGGGSRNALLCRMVAQRSGLPVLAGPAEATAIGNLVVQARANGAIEGDITELRDLVRRSFPPIVHAL
ncbi:rhamnulokinase family protein [Leifsonia kafniensis]|uniref:Rhamnulokinase family protein n=1 Tax=Leifsonia kafniensis TaxID=475957 RepID=A0ABP7L2F0_9MICO